MAKLVKTSFYNNPFIGLYLRASDKLVLCPPTASEKLVLQARESLAVEPIELFVNNSPLLGVFTAVNSNGVVLPSFAENNEAKKLKRLGLNVCFLEKLAPGNNILVNDHAALASEKVSKQELRMLRDCFGVEVLQQRFAGFPLASTTVVTNKGLLAYNEITALELKKLEKTFSVRGASGTSNMGVVFNSLGVIANSKGALVGMRTSGFEAQRIFEALFGE